MFETSMVQFLIATFAITVMFAPSVVLILYFINNIVEKRLTRQKSEIRRLLEEILSEVKK